MKYLKILLLCGLFIPFKANAANECDCLKLTVISKEVNGSSCVFKVMVDNKCIRRMWFYTKGFWARHTEMNKNAETYVLQRMHGEELPEFVQFKWNEDKVFLIKTEYPDLDVNKIKLSYSNSEHIYPSRFLGASTFTCDVEIN